MPTMVQMILRASLSGINAGWSNLSKNAPTRRPPRRPPSNPTLAPRIMRSDDPRWRTLQIPYSNKPPELEFQPERPRHAKGPRQSAARHLRGSWLVIVRTAATIGQIENSGRTHADSCTSRRLRSDRCDTSGRWIRDQQGGGPPISYLGLDDLSRPVHFSFLYRLAYRCASRRMAHPSRRICC